MGLHEPIRTLHFFRVVVGADDFERGCVDMWPVGRMPGPAFDVTPVVGPEFYAVCLIML